MTGQQSTNDSIDADFEQAAILPLLSGEGNQRLMVEWIESHDRYTLVGPDESVETAVFDFCLLDGETLRTHAETLRARKREAEPVLLPCLLLVPEADLSLIETDRGEIADSVVFETADEVVSMPIKKAELEWRTEALLRLRSQSQRLDSQRHELRLFKQAAEAAGHAIYITDTDGSIEYVNPAFEEITGYDRSVAVGETPALLNSGEMPQEYYDELWETVTSGEVWEEEVINRRKNDELYTAHQTIAPITDDNVIRAFVAIQTDITDRQKRIERIHRLSEYRQIRSQINQLLITDIQKDEILPKITETIATGDRFGCTFLAVLDADFSEFLCQSGSELTQHDVEAFHTDEYIEAVTEAGTLHMEDVTVPPFEQHPADSLSHEGYGLEISHRGTRYGILTVHFPPGDPATDEEVRLLKDLANDVGLFLHTRETEAQRRAFAEIVQQLGDPVMLQNRDGTFRFVNEAVTEYAKMAREDLYGETEFAFMDEGAARRIQARKEQVLDQEEPVKYTISPTFPSEDEETFSTVRYPYYDEDGSLAGTIAICRVVTELKSRENQLRVMDRVLRHNLRNDMTTIGMFAEKLEESVPEELAEDTDRIKATSKRVNRMVEKQRKITKFLTDNQHKQTIDLTRAVEAVVTRQRENHQGADIQTDLPQTCPVKAIPELEQGINELVENAVVHSDRETPSIEVRVTINQDGPTLRVADDGPGIPELDQQILTGKAAFDQLYHGSGLGLWLVYLIVTQTGGVISVAANAPRGSVVTIHFPV